MRPGGVSVLRSAGASMVAQAVSWYPIATLVALCWLTACGDADCLADEIEEAWLKNPASRVQGGLEGIGFGVEIDDGIGKVGIDFL